MNYGKYKTKTCGTCGNEKVNGRCPHCPTKKRLSKRELNKLRSHSVNQQKALEQKNKREIKQAKEGWAKIFAAQDFWMKNL